MYRIIQYSYNKRKKEEEREEEKGEKGERGEREKQMHVLRNVIIYILLSKNVILFIDLLIKVI